MILRVLRTSLVALTLAATAGVAAPVKYKVDSNHTYPELRGRSHGRSFDVAR